MATITDKQREKRIRRKLAASGKIKAPVSLLQKENLTERDRLHLYRVLLPSMLVKCRQDLALWAKIEQQQVADIPHEERTPEPGMTLDELKQFEREILADQAAIEAELGDERVLVKGRWKTQKAVYSEPKIGV